MTAPSARLPGRPAARLPGQTGAPVGVRDGVRIEARGWGWRHATRKAWAVRGLDFVIEPGERVLLLGQSGAGKSTLLAGIAGLLDPENSGDEEGELLLDGVPARQARLDGVRAGRARTGLLLQDPNAQTVLARCGDDVAFGCENHGLPTAQIWPRVDQALASVGFGYDRMHSTAALSGGERQRLALAGLLALQPDLLLLDEPTAMLDPDGAALVREAVAQVLAGAGCLLVEHRVEPWLPLVERVLVLAAGGGLLADGVPGDVFAGHGSSLADDGVWMPGLAARLTARLTSRLTAGIAERPATIELGSRTRLLVAEQLSAGRPGSPLSRRGRRPAPVVRGIDLELHAGRAVCLTGPNGVGKSTLALTLAGLVAPAAGRLHATSRLLAGPAGSGRGLPPEPVRWPARALVSRIGTVFQDPRHQFVARTVRDELLVGPRQAGLAATEAGRRVDLLLERLRLQHLAGANPFTLSGGEQRRLSVATVLAAAPSVLVLDEPTFGQDARTWAELATLLLEVLDEGCALVCATHDRELVRVLAAAGEELSLAGGPVAA